MMYLVFSLVLIAALLIWDTVRIAGLEAKIDDLQRYTYETLTDDFDDTADDLFLDIAIIRKHLGLDDELFKKEKKEYTSSWDHKDPGDLPF